jgi:predicted HicB family RNase H-like nuclease
MDYPEAAMPEPVDKKRVRLSVDNDKHDELRVLAARSGMSMSQYCEAVVLEAVQKKRVLKVDKK